jgi:uncharacterized protein YycO
MIIISLILASCQPEFELRSGDLLFQDIDCGDYCESIEKVTVGYKGARFSHVGIYSEEDGRAIVIEAVSAGVVQTPLDSFLARTLDSLYRPKVMVGRFRSESNVDIKEGLERATAFIGKEYDPIYELENDQYYCSELVYFSFCDTQGKPILQPEPMTFLDTDSNKTFHLWKSYFEAFGVEIPEGRPGLNPGSISRSPHIDIVHMYGQADGFGSRP